MLCASVLPCLVLGNGALLVNVDLLRSLVPETGERDTLPHYVRKMRSLVVFGRADWGRLLRGAFTRTLRAPIRRRRQRLALI